MAVMRSPTLPMCSSLRIVVVRCFAGWISSQNRRQGSMFPSGRHCRPPRRQSLKPGPQGPGFFAPQTILPLLETSDVIGKIGNLGISDGCKHRRHHAIVAVPDVVAVLAHCLYKEILALIGDMRNAFTAGQIEIVAAIATMLRDQRAASLHASGICWKRGKRGRRLLGKKF